MTRFASAGVLVVAALGAIGMVISPDGRPVHLLVGLLAVLVMVTGTRRHRRVRPQFEHGGRVEPWLLLSLGLFSLVVGGGLRLPDHALAAPGDFPGGPELVTVAGYLITLIGVMSLVRDRFPGRALDTLLEAGLAVGPVGLMLWAGLVGPRIADARLDVPAAAIASVTIVLALMTAFVAAAPLFLPYDRPRAQVFLAWGLGCVAASHVGMLVGVVRGGFLPAGILGAVAVAGYGLWAASGVDPSVGHLHEPIPSGRTQLGRRQLGLLVVSAATGPALLPIPAVRTEAVQVACLTVGIVAVSAIGLCYLVRLVQSRERVEWRAHHDELTGLPNRTVYSDRLSLALAHARRSNHYVGVMFLDLDRFKNVNDSLGHAEGNRLLQMTAKRVNGCLREGDTVSRLGGDEFAVLLPQVAGPDDAVDVAKKILGVFQNPFKIDKRELFISTSIGIAVFPNDGTDSDSLVRNADAAMYRAKDKGRNTYHQYSRDDQGRVHDRLALESALHKAIEKNEMLLFYQPKVELRTGRITGVEARVRWRHPQRGLVPPDEFISVAEETGMIGELGEWVLRRACEQCQAWRDAAFPDITMAVNVSPRQFRDQRIPEVVARVLRATGLRADFLELEVTESLAMETTGDTLQAFLELRRLGVRCSIDDFGSGYSSLSYLTQLPIEKLKIDKSFVQRLHGHDGGNDAAVVRAIIVLAHSLGLQVVAEGVETQEQLAFLERQGCDQMQGFLFSRPVPAENLETLFMLENVAQGPGRLLRADGNGQKLSVPGRT